MSGGGLVLQPVVVANGVDVLHPAEAGGGDVQQPEVVGGELVLQPAELVVGVDVQYTQVCDLLEFQETGDSSL